MGWCLAVAPLPLTHPPGHPLPDGERKAAASCERAAYSSPRRGEGGPKDRMRGGSHCVLSRRLLVGHAFDFDLAVDHHVGLDTGAGRGMLAEIAFVHGIERPEIARIVEPNAAPHHVLEPIAGLFENGDDV